MRTLLMLCGLSVAPCVSLAELADLPSANPPANSTTLSSNMPATVPEAHPLRLAHGDTTPPSHWPPAWWPFRPTAALIGREPPRMPPPAQADAIAVLQRQLEAARTHAHAPALHVLTTPAQHE